MQAFDQPVGIDWLATGTASFVADRDISVPPGAFDGIIAGRVVPGTGGAADKTWTYFTDPTPTPADSDPVFCGNAVDNDDAEVVFCDIGGNSIVVFTPDGAVVSTLALPPAGGPRSLMWITCQSGTGAAGGGGGGGGGGGSWYGSGATDDNDNGDSVASSKKKKSKFHCFVATASWGQGSGPVSDLVAFRSDWLHGAQAGRVFDRMYYGFGPAAAAAIGGAGAQSEGRIVLAPFAFAARGGAATGAMAGLVLVAFLMMAVRRMR